MVEPCFAPPRRADGRQDTWRRARSRLLLVATTILALAAIEPPREIQAGSLDLEICVSDDNTRYAILRTRAANIGTQVTSVELSAGEGEAFAKTVQNSPVGSAVALGLGPLLPDRRRTAVLSGFRTNSFSCPFNFDPSGANGKGILNLPPPEIRTVSADPLFSTEALLPIGSSDAGVPAAIDLTLGQTVDGIFVAGSTTVFPAGGVGTTLSSPVGGEVANQSVTLDDTLRTTVGNPASQVIPDGFLLQGNCTHLATCELIVFVASGGSGLSSFAAAGFDVDPSLQSLKPDGGFVAEPGNSPTPTETFDPAQGTPTPPAESPTPGPQPGPPGGPVRQLPIRACLADDNTSYFIVTTRASAIGTQVTSVAIADGLGGIDLVLDGGSAGEVLTSAALARPGRLLPLGRVKRTEVLSGFNSNEIGCETNFDPVAGGGKGLLYLPLPGGRTVSAEPASSTELLRPLAEAGVTDPFDASQVPAAAVVQGVARFKLQRLLGDRSAFVFPIGGVGTTLSNPTSGEVFDQSATLDDTSGSRVGNAPPGNTVPFSGPGSQPSRPDGFLLQGNCSSGATCQFVVFVVEPSDENEIAMAAAGFDVDGSLVHQVVTGGYDSVVANTRTVTPTPLVSDTPTPTRTPTVTRTATASASRTRTRTPTATATTTDTRTQTPLPPTATASATPVPTDTPTPPPTPTETAAPTETTAATETVTPTPGPCFGDCSGDGRFDEADLHGVVAQMFSCDRDADCSEGLADDTGEGCVSAAELVRVWRQRIVEQTSAGCPPNTRTPPATRTSTHTRTPTPTFTPTIAPSNTPTRTFTPTFTPPFTATVTRAPSSTPTPSLTPIPAFECGDGEIESSEECDDRNRRPCDGCSNVCLVEANFNCDGEPSVCSTILDFPLSSRPLERALVTYDVPCAADGDGGGAQVSPEITIPIEAEPHGIAISEDGTRAFVAARSPDGLVVVDLVHHLVERQVPLGDGPEAVACVDENCSTVLVTNYFSGTVAAVDWQSGTFQTIPVGLQPTDVAVGLVAAYVTNRGDSTVTAIDLATLSPVKTLSAGFNAGSQPRSVTFSPDGTRAYVASFLDSTVVEYDAVAHNRLRTINVDAVSPVAAFPTAIAASTDGSLLYVVNWTLDGMVLIDTASFLPVFGTVVPVGPLPTDIVLNPRGDRALVTNVELDENGGLLPGRVTVVDLATLQPLPLDTVVSDLPISVVARRPVLGSPPPTMPPAATPTTTPVAGPESCGGAVCDPAQVCVRDVGCYTEGCTPRDACCDPGDLTCGVRAGGNIRF